MLKEELQERISECSTSAEKADAAMMLEIAKSYLRGDFLQDKIAAEGWLMKVIELEDANTSALAMAYLARDVLGKEKVLSDEDYRDIWKEYQNAQGVRKKELEQLLSFGTKEQKSIIKT